MKRHVLLLVLAVALLGAGSAQALLIDNFDTAQGPIARVAVGITSGGVVSSAAGDIVGGDRELELEVLSAGTGSSANIQFFGVALGGTALNLNNGSGSDAVVRLTYDNNGAGLGGVDLTDGGASPWFIFRISAIDHDLVVKVELTDTDGDIGANTYVKLEPGSLEDCSVTVGPPCPAIVGPITGIPGNYYHALDAFVSGGIDPVTGLAFGGHNAALNLASIDRIVVSFQTAAQELDVTIPCIYTGAAPSGAVPSAQSPFASPDFSTPDGADLNCVPEVPEPGSMLLLGTGLLGLGLVGARSRLMRRRQA